MTTTSRPIVPSALLALAVVAAVVAMLPDSLFGLAIGAALGRATTPETLVHWHALQRVAVAVAIAAGGLGLAGLWQWRWIAGWVSSAGGRLDARPRDWLFDCVSALLVLTAVHGVSLFNGQLRGDDYPFLREAARAPLSELILRPWGGHFFPLWRVEVVTLYRLWGLDSEPYRWWLFGQVALLGCLQARVLAAWGLSRGARLLGIVTLCGWTQWAQITMGYWTVSICVKVWIAVWCAVLALASEGEPRTGRKAAVMVAALAAMLADTSGVIVVPAVLAGAIAWRARDGGSPIAVLRGIQWPAAVAFVCVVIFALGQWILSIGAYPVLGAKGGPYTIGLAAHLLSFGTVGALFAPMLGPQLPLRAAQWLAALIPLAGAVVLLATWRRATSRERAALGFFTALMIGGLALVVGGRPYADYRFMVRWTHYVAFLYLPMTGVIAVGWHTLRRTRAWSGATQVQWLALACALVLGAQEASSRIADRMRLHAGRTWERRFAGERAEAMRVVRDSILEPLARAMPEGAVLPQMQGAQLDARFPRLNPMLPLSYYVDLAGERARRLEWVAAPLPDDFAGGPADATAVTRMRDAVDPAFRDALRAPSYWRDTYFGSAPIVALPTLAVACDAARRAGPALAGDAGRARWLLLDVVAAAADDATLVDMAFRTGFREKAVYTIRFEAAAPGCYRLEMLGLAELAMSDRIEVTAFEARGGRRVEMLGLWPARRGPVAAR